MYLTHFGKLFFQNFLTFFSNQPLYLDYKYIAGIKIPITFKHAHVANAAAISSATQPTPPSNTCNPLIPSGFLMSKNLNNPKPTSNPQRLYPSAQIGIKQNIIATNSSRTILPGSRIPSARSAESHTPMAMYDKNDANKTYCTIPHNEFEPIPEKINA